MAGKGDVFVAVGKVPAYNRGVLTAADDSTCVKLEFEHSRVCPVCVEGRSQWVWSVVMVMVMVVMMRLRICWTLLSDCCMIDWLVGRYGRPGCDVTHSDVVANWAMHSL